MTDGAPCSIRNLTRGDPTSTYKWTIQAQGSSLGSLSATQMSDEVRPVANFRKVLPIGGNEDLLEAQLEGDRLEFFRSATGIYDVDELKKHILAVHRAAYEVSPSACPFHGFMTHGLNAGSPVSMSRQVQLRKVRWLTHPLRLSDFEHMGYRLRLSRLPAYGQLLELGKSREHPILLEVGCCCRRLHFSCHPELFH